MFAELEDRNCVLCENVRVLLANVGRTGWQVVWHMWIWCFISECWQNWRPESVFRVEIWCFISECKLHHFNKLILPNTWHLWGLGVKTRNCMLGSWCCTYRPTCTITLFIKTNFYALYCVLNHIQIFTRTCFGIFWCHLQGVLGIHITGGY